MEIAPELPLDRLPDLLRGSGVRIGQRGFVSTREARGGTEPTVDGCGSEGVASLALLPQVGRDARESVVLDRAQQEVGGAAHRGPEIGVERLVAELTPGSLVRKEDGPGLVELVRAPGRGE